MKIYLTVTNLLKGSPKSPPIFIVINIKLLSDSLNKTALGKHTIKFLNNGPINKQPQVNQIITKVIRVLNDEKTQ